MTKSTFERFKTELFLLAAKKDKLVELKKCLREYYVHIGIPIVEVNHPFLARARYNENGEIFRSKQQVSYNPFSDKIDLQRANYKGQQVFYGAIPSFKGGNFCSLTALLECGMQYVKDEKMSRETFTLTRWTINRPLRVVILPFSRKSIERNTLLTRLPFKIRS